ncbi:MAG: hypothetical protein EXR88_04740 [Gammaproteobacteria bacterium]|nr:hypothetical protein [Gammaproteobacteria bacterium]
MNEITPHISPRAVFIPVSGPRGMGEFARSLTIANALQSRWPELLIHFMVHQDAPYAKSLKFPHTLLPASPTLCSSQVITLLREFKPQLVYLDNAGRTDVLRVARALGAHVVYVSSRSRQRYKAFRLRWMRLLSQHWISYPALIAGSLTSFERWKLRWLGRPTIKFLDAVIAPPAHERAIALLAGFGNPDLIIVPGGGSQFHDAPISPEHFFCWGKRLAQAGYRVVFVAGPSFDVASSSIPNLCLLYGVGGGALMALLQRSKVILVNGGDTLLQSLSLGKACVAVPIAGDQAVRIDRCAALGVVIAPLPENVVDACANLITDSLSHAILEAKARQFGLKDALPQIMKTLGGYLGLAD